ncbi:MAG TPA: hypothetical protein ENN09_03300, partial [Planctomycetes bacterium]|nr:hypothetical protein [Planctomycetota bacterium]
MKTRTMAAALFIAVLATAGSVYGAWSSDPAVNNPIAATAVSETSNKMVYDGNGGYFIVWKASNPVRVQRIDADGNLCWGAEGILVTDSGSYPKIASDAKGGCFVSWKSGHVYVQRYDAAGNEMWTPGGVIVCDSSLGADCAWMDADGTGGCFVSNYGGYAQKLSPSGALLWGDASNPAQWDADPTHNPSGARVAHDGSGGAVFAWYDWNTSIVYVQRLNSSGVRQWNGGDPVALSDTGYDQCPRLLKSGNYFYVIWSADGGSDIAIQAQKISMNGVPQWTHPDG